MTDRYKEVEAASRKSPATLYTDAALNEAAALLTGLYATGDHHGILQGDWTGQSVDLPGIALCVITARYRRILARQARQDGGEARYRRMEAALTQADAAPVGTYRGRIVLPRFDTTPEWGWSGEAALTVGFYTGDGWTLELAQERTPVIDLVAPTEAAIAELVADVLRGRRADPMLARPRW